MSDSVSTLFIGVKDLHLSHDLLDKLNHANAIKVFWRDCGAIPYHGVLGHGYLWTPTIPVGIWVNRYG